MGIGKGGFMNCKEKKELVNTLRHDMMDGIVFNNEDNEVYFQVYSEIMTKISASYPSLSEEVEKQMAKKIRRMARRATA